MDLQNEQHYVTPEPTALSGQTSLATSRIVVNSRFVLRPVEVNTDIVLTNLPYWKNTKTWVLVAPPIGYGCHFSEYLLYVNPQGGSDLPEIELGVESFIFILDGRMRLKLGKDKFDLTNGGFAYIPPDKTSDWSIWNNSGQLLKFLWIRKVYAAVESFKPMFFINNVKDVNAEPMDNSENMMMSQMLFPKDDLSYDMAVNINNWQPGCLIPQIESHLNEHGLYMLQGQGVYYLNGSWYEVKAGDFIWMAPFCPQSYYSGGKIWSRYLLYKDVNRHANLISLL